MDVITPKTARRFTDVLKMKRDNVSTAKSWIMLDWPEIIISNQRNGEDRTGKTVLSRREFERFIKFYETGR